MFCLRQQIDCRFGNVDLFSAALLFPSAAMPPRYRKILPKIFVSKSGTAMFGSTLSVNPRCAASAEAAPNKECGIHRLPSVIHILEHGKSRNSAYAPDQQGSKAAIPHSELFPIRLNGFDNARRSISAVGRLPSITIPIAETVFIASSSGVSLAISRNPVMY